MRQKQRHEVVIFVCMLLLLLNYNDFILISQDAAELYWKISYTLCLATHVYQCHMQSYTPQIHSSTSDSFNWLFSRFINFYRATACNATHGIAVAILSVCPSVCPSVRQMRVLTILNHRVHRVHRSHQCKALMAWVDTGSRHISLLSYMTTVRTTIPVPVLL